MHHQLLAVIPADVLPIPTGVWKWTDTAVHPSVMALLPALCSVGLCPAPAWQVSLQAWDLWGGSRYHHVPQRAAGKRAELGCSRV